jgi:cytidylate kinase
MPKRVIVAIDGPAGAGKSTIARRIAQRLGYVYIDTGAMYRAVGLWALRAGIPLSDAHRLEQLAQQARIEFANRQVLLNNEDVTQAIREPEVSQAASQVASCPGVRRAMVDEQRRIAASVSCVMEGRDIGTIVFPEAQVKIFLDADPNERVRRRSAETHEDQQAVAKEMAERDRRDRTRAEAPLIQAPDAEYLDSSTLTLEQVEEAVLKVVRAKTSNGKAMQS